MIETWQSAARRLDAARRRVIRVSVAGTRGSAPRDAGASMLVAEHGVWGTIGGGRLEWEALCEARRLLGDASSTRVEREFVLGPDLNQCCGGRVTLAMEAVTDDDLREPVKSRPAQRLQLHGAGHVAQALVAALTPLPGFDLQWLDTRPTLPVWNEALPAYRRCADPVAAVADAPAGALVLVMTHDHALDYEICRAVLRRDDALWLGLIASASKAARFRSRFAREGLAPQAARLLQAPVGLPGIAGKEPAVIAVAIVAQLLLLASQGTPAGCHPATADGCGACANCSPAEART